MSTSPESPSADTGEPRNSISKAGARTKLDVIYHEVLGEVSDLVSRAEAVSEQINKTSAANASMQIRLKSEIDKAGAALALNLKPIVDEASAAAATVAGASRKLALYALLLGLAGGVLGGTIAGLALAKIFLG